MSVYIVEGDLLKSDCNIIAHQANCKSTMGSGIAVQIKKLYPEACRADHDFHLPPQKRLGKFSVAKTYSQNGEILIGNLYGQYDYGTYQVQTNYAALENALTDFIEYIAKGPYTKLNTKIGLTYNIGCGLAGGDWTVVKEIIEKVAMSYGIDIYLYKLGEK